jgi:hypothetical protein
MNVSKNNISLLFACITMIYKMIQSHSQIIIYKNKHFDL